MRHLCLAGAALVAAVSGCAAISGLGDYEDMPAAEKAALEAQDASGGDDASSIGIGTDDASGATTDDGSPDQVLSSLTDAGDLYDAPLAPDAIPACTAQSCPNGCCDSQGGCSGGRSVDTCGTGGEACKSCASGDSCSSAGACVATVVDSGATAPVCPASCEKCGIAQTTCCKSDKSCGCAYPFAPCN
jgi:hypothetical protein